MNILLILFFALVAYMYIGYLLGYFLYKKYVSVYSYRHEDKYFSWFNFWFPGGLPVVFWDEFYISSFGGNRKVDKNAYIHSVTAFWPIRLIFTVILFVAIGLGIMASFIFRWILFPLRTLLK